MNNVELRIPLKKDLIYRKNWMNDPKTMEYNAGYDIELKGYDKNTGTIRKTNQELNEWYDKWSNKEPDKFFAYIYDSNIEEPVGEIYYYLDNDIHSMGILIADKYRGNGYSTKALLELEKIAFEKNNINELSDMIPLDRIGAINCFIKAGFRQTDIINEEIKFGKAVNLRQLLLTKKEYKSRKELK